MLRNLAILLGVIILVFFAASRYSSTTPAPVASPNPSPLNPEQAIKRDLETAGTQVNSIDKIVGEYAKGQMPMAYWIAKKIDSKWQVVVAGNGIPSCVEIDKYEVPAEIYGKCINASGELRP